MKCEHGIDDLAGKTIVLRRGFSQTSWRLGALALNWNSIIVTRRLPDNPELLHKP
jgi:hypothetical protein